MVAIAEAVFALHPSARPLVDYVVADMGAGPFLAAWHLPGPQPTPEQLAAVTPEQVAAARRSLVRTLTPLEWLDRLPIDRQIAVMEAVNTSPPARLWWLKLQLAVEIDLDSPLTTGGVAYLVAGGVLTDADAAALLA